MDESQTAKVEPEPQQREWVTPSFQQVALKDALGGSGAVNQADATVPSS